MSAVAELINQLCPNGVEYKTLGETCARHHGTMITAGRMAQLSTDDGDVRVFAAGSTVANIPSAEIPANDVIREPGVIVKSRGYIGFEFCDCPFTHKNELWSYTVKDNGVDLKFVYYYLQTRVGTLQKLARSKSVKLPQLATGDTDKLEIPVPPLPVQQEIVRRLDAMTGLIEDLEKELAARQKQYEWVREEAFKQLEAEGVERKKLGEICTYSTRRIGVSHVTAKTFVSVENMLQERRGRMDAVSVPTVGNVISFEVGDVLIGNIRPYLKKIWCADTSGGTNGDVLVIQRKDSESILSRYLYQVLSSDDFFRYDMKYSKGAKMPRGDKVAVMKYLVPVPPLPAQQQIVRRLDEMTELIAVIEKEIALRKQQYEYCRERLLTFSRAG